MARRPEAGELIYGDLSRLNKARVILDAVGAEALRNIADDFLELLGSSCAIHEKTGDYALGIIRSNWCRLLHEASFRLCGTDDLAGALACGRWLCHEASWRDASLASIERNEPVDVDCYGGIRLYAVPIRAEGEVIGSINFGYGTPPDGPESLAEVAKRFRIPHDRLNAAAADHPHGSPELIEEARRRLRNAAQLIGLMVERHRAQQAAREAAERHRLLFETMSQGVLYFDAEGRVVEANPAACRILGRTLEDLKRGTDRTVAAFRDEQGRPLSYEELPAARARREARRVVGEIVGYPNPVDGRVHWLKGEAVPLIEPGESSPRQVYTVVTDVTEQKEAEQALRKSEERLRLSMQAANQGFYDLDLRTGEAVVSPEYATMLGHDPAEFHETNARWLDRLHPDDRERVEAMHRSYLAGEISEYSVEFRQRTRDGGWKWIWSIGRIVERDADGTPRRMMGTHTDIDERKHAELARLRAEEQLRHVQKLESLGVLAGGIAHDFNNLLTAVLGNADLALHTMTSTHPAREFVSSIETASQRAAELCRQMLAYAGRGRFVLERLDLSQVVHEMGHILKVSTGKDATLRYDLAADLPPVEADASQMRQVVMNLITNAAEALGGGGGVVSVTTGRMTCDRDYLDALVLGEELAEGDYVFLEVADTGTGMNEAVRARIFDPFFTTKFTGRGLGLAAVLGVVRGHRGAIKLYSEPGRGTTFKVLFPATEGKAGVVGNDAAQAETWTGSGVVLLVDDEPDVREVASHMLRRLGFEVLTAVDGHDAVKQLRENPQGIACVLLDLTMPRMGGEEAFRELRRISEDVPVVLSSGYNQQEVTQRFAGKGHAGFVQKPYTTGRLRDALRQALEA